MHITAINDCIDYENLLVRNNYSYYLSLRSKNLERARELSYYTIKVEPDNSTYLDTYGWILFKMGNSKDAIKYIENNYTDEITRESLAKVMNMNSDYLGRMFKKLTDKNISDYINECRLKKACEMLINSDENIVDIAFAVGFESLPTFYRVFKKIMNETPINYRIKYQQNSN